MQYFLAVVSLVSILFAGAILGKIGEIRTELGAAVDTELVCVSENSGGKSCLEEEARVVELQEKIGTGWVLVWMFGVVGGVVNMLSMGFIMEEDIFEGLDLMKRDNGYRIWLCLIWPVGLVVAAYIAIDRSLTGALE